MAKTIKENVEEILKKYKDTRDSDKLLILKYWEIVDGVDMNDIESFKKSFIFKSTPMESIVRARRLIQEEGNYLPNDPVVIRKRRKREIAMFEAVTERREVV